MTVLTAAALATGVEVFRHQLSDFLIGHAWSQSLKDQTNTRPFPWMASYPVAELSFPDTGRKMIVMSGVSGAVLEYAPLWNEGSDRPGSAGISLISGDHRSQFGFLKHMDAGDSFDLRTASGEEKHYQVEEMMVVGDEPVKVGKPGGSVVILSTSYPYKDVSGEDCDCGEDMRLVAVAREIPAGSAIRFAGIP